MSDKPSNFELDDELLSAYIDGELTADERAAVEARLETDPAAQQLLHELRSVSQSVQALPTESVGRDLSDDILRHVQVVREVPVVRASPDPAPASDRRSPTIAAGPIPKIRIFGSQRAWIWAAMALAAGLLIMFFQPGDKSAKQLPDLAQRNRAPAETQLADDATRSPRREISLSPAPAAPSPPPASVAGSSGVHDELRDKASVSGGAMPTGRAAGAAGGGPSSGVAHNGVASEPPSVAAAAPKLEPRASGDQQVFKAETAASTPVAKPDQLAKDRTMSASQLGASAAVASGALASPAEKQKSESTTTPAPQRFIVVHVAVKPEALKKGAFDKLLANHQIELIAEPAKNAPASRGPGALAKSVNDEAALKDESNKVADAHPVEMVLVEAPAATIESCLAELNKNTNDFPSIAVSDETSSADRFDVKSTPIKKLEEGSGTLSRFSRGNVPAAQKQTFDSRFYLYDSELAKPSGTVTNGSPRAGGFGGNVGKIAGKEQDANGNRMLADNKQAPEGLRRARRIETASSDKSGIDTRQLDQPAPAGPSSPPAAGESLALRPADAMKRPMSESKSNQQAAVKTDNDDNWKVLFVFTAEEMPAPSTSPSTPQK